MRSPSTPGIEQSATYLLGDLAMSKRTFDMVASALGLLLLSPVFLMLALLIKLTSPGPVIFRQERMGRGFRPFLIYKFRTMVQDAPRLGGPVTFGEDPRITPVGQWLRKTKLDEFPQLTNVLKGEMSFVGPRPEVRKYVMRFRRDYENILQVRPGITDLASLKYHNEAAILGRASDPEEEYVRQVLPDKIRLAQEYLRRSSFFFDLGLILKTILTAFTLR